MFNLVYKTFRNSRVFNRELSNLYKYSDISNIYSHRKINDKITIKGWVKSLRKLKENVFIDVSDGSCDQRLQVLVSRTQKPSNLTTGSSIEATGSLNVTPKGQLELAANELKVTGDCVVADGYPFAPRKSYPPEYVRQYLHFRSRTNKFASLLRVRDAASKAVHDYFHSEGYFNIHTPILTSNDCEGAGEVFSVRPERKSLLKSMLRDGVSEDEAYFDSKVFLTVSGQLHLEAIVHGMGKVYTFGPTFRAENSKSRLHLSEFYMIEAETAFVSNLAETMQTIERLVKSVTKTILDQCSEDVARLHGSEKRDLSWVDKQFIIMSYDEALTVLEKHKNKLTSRVNKEEGFSKEHEIFLVDYNGGTPTFVINWPKELKPFYMKQCSGDCAKV